MIDFDGQIFGTIMITRVATFEDYCEHKPNRVKQIGTADGTARYVCKSKTRNRSRYWCWACAACKRTGVIRADTLKKWAENGHQCPCRRKQRRAGHKLEQHKGYGSFKLCKYLNHKLPATTAFFYQSKAGYLSTNCRACSRIIAAGKRDTIPVIKGFGCKYDRNLGCVNDF